MNRYKHYHICSRWRCIAVDLYDTQNDAIALFSPHYHTKSNQQAY